MRLGFHIWIGEGLVRVPDLARRRRAQTVQFFSHNPRGWYIPPIDKEQARAFKEKVEEFDIRPVFIHMPYLCNLASLREDFYLRSIDTLVLELERAELLGAQFLVTHMGNSRGGDEVDSINRLVQAINNCLEKVKNSVMVLLENTAGGGTQIGYKFSQIKSVIEGVEQKNRIGVCLDTAHAFAAGYDISQPKGLERTLEEFERLVGFDRLKLLHLNDSRTPLGSHIDRHWHIGKGYIGKEGFRNIVNHPRLSLLPAIMETPYKNERDDVENLDMVESLLCSH